MKRNVKLFSMILALICAISMIPTMSLATSAEAAASARIEIPAEGTTMTIDGKEYVIVRTVEDLTTTAQEIHDDQKLPAEERTNIAYNWILANDLDFTGKSFVKIPLRGTTFNGNGYSIYGFSMTGSADISAFSAANLSDFNVIKNLTVGQPNNKVQVTSTVSGKSIGTIFGYTNAKHTLENVTVYADLSTNGSNTGGIGGNVKGTLNLKNCAFYGSVTDNSSNPKGGFFGKMNDGTLVMENCVNYGTVNTGTDAGGLIGKTTGSNCFVTIKNCVNVGSVKGGSTGGFIGSQGTDNDTYIENSLNLGTVNAKSNGGAFIGWSNSSKKITFTNCVNFGSITSGGKAGGISAFSYANFKYENVGSFGSVVSNGTECGVFFGQNDATTGTATNVFYTPIENTTNSILVDSATQKTIAEAIAWTNELIGANVGNLVLNTAGNGAVLAAPKFAGVQESAVADGTFDVRLIATLNDSLNYSAVGFEIALAGGKTVTKECVNVYGKLLSTTEQGFAAEVTAAQLNGTYLFALAIENVPATGTVTFTVTPYAKALDGTTVYSGASYNVTYTNGAYVGTTVA